MSTKTTKKIKTHVNKKNGITWTSDETRNTLRYLWASMWRRCTDPDHPSFSYYKRVPIYRDWKDFAVFKQWAIENGYKEGLSPDRKDPGYGYVPGNIRFVDPRLNKKTPLMVSFEGKKQKLVDIAERFSIKDSNLRYYYYKGYNMQDAVDKILNSGRKKRNDIGVSRSKTISGEELKSLIKQCGMNQKQMSKALNVSQQRFSAWCLNKNSIPWKYVAKIKEILGDDNV